MMIVAPYRLRPRTSAPEKLFPTFMDLDLCAAPGVDPMIAWQLVKVPAVYRYCLTRVARTNPMKL